MEDILISKKNLHIVKLGSEEIRRMLLILKEQGVGSIEDLNNSISRYNSLITICNSIIKHESINSFANKVSHEERRLTNLLKERGLNERRD